MQQCKTFFPCLIKLIFKKLTYFNQHERLHFVNFISFARKLFK